MPPHRCGFVRDQDVTCSLATRTTDVHVYTRVKDKNACWLLLLMRNQYEEVVCGWKTVSLCFMSGFLFVHTHTSKGHRQG